MTFSLSSEQKEFQSVLRAFFSEHLSSEYLRRRIANPPRRDAGIWAKFSELGLPESFGGDDPELRVGFRELSLLAFECGRALVPEPLYETAFFGPFLLTQLLPPAERKCLGAVVGEQVLQELMEGVVSPGIAVTSGIAGSSSGASALKLSESLLSGALPFVLGPSTLSGGSPVWILERMSASRARLLLVAGDASKSAYTSVDLLDRTLSAHHASWTKAPCAQLEGPLADRSLQLLQVLRTLEIAGACSRAVEMTVEFVKTREQFGVPIGGFQAVQHRLADMYLQTEALSALARFAAWAAEGAPEQLPLASVSGLAQAIEQGSSIIEAAIQLHGGIGFTYEYDLHFFLRRVKCLEALYRFSEEELTSLLGLAA